MTTLAAEMSASRTSPRTKEARPRPRRARHSRVISPPGRRRAQCPGLAPNCFAAAITMRPSPEPRSTTTSAGRVCASCSMRCTTSSGVVMNGTVRDSSAATKTGKRKRRGSKQASSRHQALERALHLKRVPVDRAEVAVRPPCRRARLRSLPEARAALQARGSYSVAIEQDREAQRHLHRRSPAPRGALSDVDREHGKRAPRSPREATACSASPRGRARTRWPRS